MKELIRKQIVEMWDKLRAAHQETAEKIFVLKLFEVTLSRDDAGIKLEPLLHSVVVGPRARDDLPNLGIRTHTDEDAALAAEILRGVTGFTFVRENLMLGRPHYFFIWDIDNTEVQVNPYFIAGRL